MSLEGAYDTHVPSAAFTLDVNNVPQTAHVAQEASSTWVRGLAALSQGFAMAWDFGICSLDDGGVVVLNSQPGQEQYFTRPGTAPNQEVVVPGGPWYDPYDTVGLGPGGFDQSGHPLSFSIVPVRTTFKSPPVEGCFTALLGGASGTLNWFEFANPNPGPEEFVTVTSLDVMTPGLYRAYFGWSSGSLTLFIRLPSPPTIYPTTLQLVGNDGNVVTILVCIPFTEYQPTPPPPQYSFIHPQLSVTGSTGIGSDYAFVNALTFNSVEIFGYKIPFRLRCLISPPAKMNLQSVGPPYIRNQVWTNDPTFTKRNFPDQKPFMAPYPI